MNVDPSTQEDIDGNARVRVHLPAYQGSHHQVRGPIRTNRRNEPEPLLLDDFEYFLRKTAPDDVPYLHDDETIRTVNLNPGERPNGSSHCRALLLGTSACLNIVNGRLLLGRWQRVFLAELDGPRSRDISVLVIGEAAQ